MSINAVRSIAYPDGTFNEKVNMDILVFFIAQMGDWKQALQQYAGHLAIGDFDRIIVVTGKKEKAFIKSQLGDDIIIYQRQYNYEHTAMQLISDMVNDVLPFDETPSMHDLTQITYLHLKGVSHHGKVSYQLHGKDWRNYLLKNFVSRCPGLVLNYDVHGCLMMTDNLHDKRLFPVGKRYFAGNHWTASVKHLRRLLPYELFLEEFKLLADNPRDHRFAAEMWALSAGAQGYATDKTNFNLAKGGLREMLNKINDGKSN